MKKTVSLGLCTVLLLAALAGCSAQNAQAAQSVQTPGSATTSLADAKQPNEAVQPAAAGNFTDEMKIPYAVDISPEDGADSVERQGDHADSPYFMHPDVYNMQPTDTLTILPQFKTIQQSSEWSCGVTAALMVLEWYDKLGDWNEETLAELRHSLDGTEMEGYPGTTLRQAMDIFDGVGGFTYISTLDYEDVTSEVWMDTIRGWLAEGKPVMIGWNDWGGHWQVIIGYDTMGTETEADDVFIVADPYDTTDHNQDGYGIYPAERLMYNFTMYDSFTEEEGGNDMLFLVPSPEA